MGGGKGFVFCGGGVGVYSVKGETDVIVGIFIEGGDMCVLWEVGGVEHVIVGGYSKVLWGVGVFVVLGS